MSRNETFEQTKAFEVDTKATLKFQGLELSDAAISGQEVDVIVKTVPSEGANDYYVTLDVNGTTELDTEFSVQDGWGGASRSHRTTITVPDADTFDVTARGGVIQ